MNRPLIQEHIISWALALVLVYFGLNEIFSPADWVVFVPSFLGQGSLANTLVVIHGAILLMVAALFIFNYGRRVAGIIVSLMLAEIIVNLLIAEGLSDIAVRDIGLLGISLALSFSSTEKKL